MNEMMQAMIDVLENQGCSYERDDDLGVVRFGIVTASVRWRCLAGMDDHERFFCASLLPVSAPPGRRMAVAELITRINCGLALGCFTLDFNDGELRFVTVVPTAGVAPTPEVLADLCAGHELLVEAFFPAIGQVVFSATPPQIALQPNPTQPAVGTEERFSLN